jgi:single-stranded-DNA-specific exonuclease
MNAAGRLDTAQYALDLLMAKDTKDAFDKAQYLEELNISRRSDQDKILKQAIIQAVEYADDPVLVVSGQDWNHGIVGIVASKLLEKYKKPVFVLQEMGDESKGSARSYGDFSAAEALKACDGIITKGGGHKLAAGITLPTKNIAKFRECINDFYKSLNLANQQSLLLPMADADAELNELTEDLFYQINLLEPFGNGNPQPILKTNNLTVTNVRKMGTEGQHLKLELRNDDEKCMQFLAFNAPESYYVDLGQRVSVWYCLDINEWQGRKTVEGRLLRIEQIN